MATTKYTGYTSSDLPATVTTTPVSTPTPSPVVDATKIGTTATTTVPPPTEPAINPNQATQIANYTASSATDATNAEVQQAQIEAEAQKARAQTMVTDYAQSQALLGNKSSDLIASRNIKDELGRSLNDKAATLRQLDAQAQGLQNEASAIPIQVQQESLGRGRTAAGIAPIQASRLRENALKALSLGQQAAIAKADYDTAKSYADQIVEAKYSGMEADLASKKTQLEWAMQQDLAPAQKKLADAQARKIEAQNKEIADKKAQEKQVSDLVINASTQGAPQALRDKAMQAKTPMEAANILGEYAGDYWGTKIKIAQYDKLRSEAEENRQKISAAGGVGTTSTASSQDQAKFLIDTISESMNLSDASGRSKARRGTESYLVGATDYTNLESKVRTVKNNLLTLATDPNIKKFFGPQMTESDVRNMLAAASTLDTEGQTPKELKDELERVQGIFQKFVPDYKPSVSVKQDAPNWASSIKDALLNPSQGGTYGFTDIKKQ